MASTQLETVLGLLKKAPFSPTVSEAEQRRGIDKFAEKFPVESAISVAETTLGDVAAERLTANPEGPVLLYLHGGGYVIGSPASHRHLAARLGKEIDGTVYSIDYRLAPESPFPAATHDGLTAYRSLLDIVPASRIAIAGDSAGGGLAFATALLVRQHNLPLPACLIGISPWVTLETGNESYDKLACVDPSLSREIAAYFASRYLSGADPRDPLASPLYADLSGLPPTLLQVGDRECFFGDATRMHQSLISAGVDSELRVWKEMFHVWHLYWPMLAEGRAAIGEAAQFIKHHCSAESASSPATGAGGR